MNAKPKLKIRGPVVAVLAVLLLLAGYVLSFGPATRLELDGRLSLTTWTTIYRPVVWLANAWEPASVAANWYTGLWGAPIFYDPRGCESPYDGG